MSKRNAESKTGDQETDDILAAMEEDGEKLPSFNDIADDDTEEEADEAADSDEDESEDEEESGDDDTEEESEDAEGDDEDSDEESEEEEADADEDEDTEDEADGEEEGEEGDDTTVEGRKVPVWQRLKEEKKLRKEAEAKLQAALSGTKPTDIDTMAKEFATKHGFKVEAAKDLLESAAALAAQQSGLDPKTKTALEAMVKSAGKNAYWEAQNKGFQKEFKSVILPLAKRDGVDPKKAEKILQGLVFDPAYAKKSTVEIYLEQFPANGKPRRKVTVESGKQRVHTQSSKRVDELTAEDVSSMSDAEFESLSEGLGKSSRSKITRR